MHIHAHTHTNTYTYVYSNVIQNRKLSEFVSAGAVAVKTSGLRSADNPIVAATAAAPFPSPSAPFSFVATYATTDTNTMNISEPTTTPTTVAVFEPDDDGSVGGGKSGGVGGDGGAFGGGGGGGDTGGVGGGVSGGGGGDGSGIESVADMLVAVCPSSSTVSEMSSNTW